MNEPTHIDLFSGIGGFAIAAAWAGFRTVAFCEIKPYCQALLKARFGAVMADAECNGQDRSAKRRGTYKRDVNWRVLQLEGWDCPPATLCGDIRTLDGTRYRGASLLTGGFPCQPFSVAGKRGGASDDRFLWPEMLRVIAEARPAWVLGENVAGIVNMELDRVLSDLENIGYASWPLVIPACAVDARHRRDRVWLVGNAKPLWESQSKRGQLDQWRRIGNASRGISEAQPHSGLQLLEGQCGRASSNCASGANANANQQQARRSPEPRSQCCAWEPEPDVGRVAHGIPHRVDRLKGLGNAIVPQVAFQILKEIHKLI